MVELDIHTQMAVDILKVRMEKKSKFIAKTAVLQPSRAEANPASIPA